MDPSQPAPTLPTASPSLSPLSNPPVPQASPSTSVSGNQQADDTLDPASMARKFAGGVPDLLTNTPVSGTPAVNDKTTVGLTDEQASTGMVSLGANIHEGSTHLASAADPIQMPEVPDVPVVRSTSSDHTLPSAQPVQSAPPTVQSQTYGAPPTVPSSIQNSPFANTPSVPTMQSPTISSMSPEMPSTTNTPSDLSSQPTSTSTGSDQPSAAGGIAGFFRSLFKK